jgi:hypothetical protein
MALTPSITADEKARRQAAVDYARGSVRLEGLHVTPQARAIYDRYIAGEIDETGMIDEIKALHRVG